MVKVCAVGAALATVALAAGCGAGAGASADRPDWCYGVDKATGQMANIGDGASNGTATTTDEAHFFDQLAGDLKDVALVASGRAQAAAEAGAIDAGQVRVALLDGDDFDVAATDLNVQMGVLGPKCGD